MPWDLSFWGVCFVIASPWLLASLRRLGRYLYLFQSVDYRKRDYYELWNTFKAERRYSHFVELLLVLLTPALCFISGPLIVAVLTYPLPSLVIYLLFAILLTGVAPKIPTEIQPQSEPNRTLRSISYAVLGIPVYVAALVTSLSLSVLSDPNNSPESMIIAPLFLLIPLVSWGMAGPFIFVFTRSTPPFAYAVYRGGNTVLMRFKRR